MLSILIKKECLKLVNSFAAGAKGDGKKAKKRLSPIFFILLWLFVFVSVGFAFFGISELLGEVLMPASAWLLFTMIALMGVALSVVMGMFTTYSSIYSARDNELLLSLPVQPGAIVISRIIPQFLIGLLWQITCLVPLAIYCSVNGYADKISLLGCIITGLAGAFLSLGLSCVLGWVIALISSRFSNKSLVKTAAALIFLAGYYYFYFNINKYLSALAANSLAIGASLQSSILGKFICLTGKGIAGDVSGMLLYALICCAVFAFVCLILADSFITLNTSSGARAKAKTFSKGDFSKATQSSLFASLFHKEWSRFISSAVYMLNCGLGLIMMIAAAVLIVINKDMLAELAEVLPYLLPSADGLLGLAALLIMFVIMSMNDITAPSISLEGRHLWILRTSPVSAADIFGAKIALQLALTIPPTVICLAALQFAFRMKIGEFALLCIGCLFYNLMHAQFGLLLNLRMPKLDWTNEAVPVKQSGSVLIALFGGWILALACGAAYYFIFMELISPVIFMAVIDAAIALIIFIFRMRLHTRGTEIFNQL